MIKKDVAYKWDKREKDAFAWIKKAIADSLALYSLDLGKYFMLYTFASHSSIAAILIQKDK